MVGRREVTARELLGEADVAMYRAKDEGRDRVARYVPGEHAAMRESLTWVERIRHALETDGFELEFQPILDVRSGEVTRYEALIRMRDGDRLIPPGAFLPTAERFGLIEAIDRWVVTRIVDVLAERERRGEPVSLEVNLSGRSFGAPATIEHIEQTIDAAGIDPGRLIFEITETAAITSLDQASAFARRLTTLGCRFALDDFGTGFGSFHYLKYMPIHYVKLDGDFVRGLPESRSDQVLVRAIADVARGLGMSTIAEFVESESILGKVREYGIDFAQGYHVGRPAPLAE
jgi:EAL domain-containing protein (putative c-di-GMP-specific phosphodiesterase class I)